MRLTRTGVPLAPLGHADFKMDRSPPAGGNHAPVHPDPQYGEYPPVRSRNTAPVLRDQATEEHSSGRFFSREASAMNTDTPMNPRRRVRNQEDCL